MFVSNICVVFALGITAFAKPISSSLTVHERRDVAPNGFTLTGPADESSQLTLRMALTSNNLAGLEKALYKTAFRNDGVIRDHLTKEQVESFVSPTNETTTQVAEWLSSHGVAFTTTSPAGDWLQINVDVTTANQLLDANFMSFNDDSTGKEVIRTLSYSIPTQLQSHIQFIHPTISFPVKAKRSPLTLKKTKSNAQTTPKTSIPNLTGRANVTCCVADEVDPTCLIDLYGIPESTAPQTTSRIGLAEFIEQFPQNADLEAFRPDLPSTLSFSLETLDGGSDPQNARDAGIEANLDVQYTIGLAVNVPVEVFEVGENNADDLDGFLDLADFVLAQTSPPQVLSIAFGFDEPDVPATLANSLCNAYMQLGARGVSVIISAGDGGVSGSQSQSCTTFIPTFPSTCPFVTSTIYQVGATQDFSPETAADFSSGGFSNIFSIPSYQATAVKNYLSSLGTTNAGKFNSSGRGFPDVSAQGVNVVIFDGGEEGTVDGSSVSVNIFSSVIGLLNAQLISSGLPVADPSILNDITSGDNPGCNTNGFSATTGWDPVTGLGTPNYPEMLLRGF
ncbi:hypothetical protein Clacol_001025 [Clathrus columnatus]|uniref:Peptidase S53 domain-containing protein n=1 Tax=Clathrus columnatus TaxID=1419009 RepID=A0AAV5A0M8_9AGAM|nr:hypothetical protein Clacol_001025 [Clathrus columnatus]